MAADDGVMPQTREHLAILSLLGVARGAVALTKADRADAAQLAAARDGIAALTAGTFLDGAPVFELCAARAATPARNGCGVICTRRPRRWASAATTACSGWPWTAFSRWRATARW